MHPKQLYINTHSDGYTPERCGETMTVAELIAYLDQFEGETPVFLINDGGYTYGSITEHDFSDSSEQDEEEARIAYQAGQAARIGGAA